MSARRPGAADRDAGRLAAAGHPVRLAILRELAERGEVCGCSFAVMASVRQPTVSHHLRILREAGLVTGRRDGNYVHYRLDPAGLADLGAVVAGLADGVRDVAVRAGGCCAPGGATTGDAQGA